MRLIVAEKPELARNIARAVCGAPDGARLPWRGNGWMVCACAGHLLELEEPSALDPDRWGAPWREETLPILPRPWPMVVSKGKERLVENVREGLAECDEVIHAGDPDDEGQAIVDNLLDHLGWDGPTKRVLVNDSIDRNIRRAFDEMDDNEGHRGAGRAAMARSIADSCFGFTESRLASIRAAHGTTLSVGRVQTPTLGLIVRRDEEIASHKAATYYVVGGVGSIDGGDRVRFSLEPDKALLDEEGRLSDKAAAVAVAERCAGARGHAETKVERKEAQPPLPYNLTELTADMSKRHKMSAKQVMEATQSLRDQHRAITYNRSDCQYLPTAALEEAPATLAQAMRNVGHGWELDFGLRPRCFDDSKIDAHTGIVPQDIEVDVARLSKGERDVYEAIVERYAMQFAGCERFETSVTRLASQDGELVHKARRQLEPGWRAVRDDGGAEKGFDPGWVEAGGHVVAMTEAAAEERKTKPKAPYTEGTLVKDMANAARYVSDPELKAALKRKDEGKPGEHGSIGTTATRAEIIEKLKQRGYITEQRGRLLSTKMGRAFYHACPKDISGVDTTARWWMIQEQVAAGEADEYAVAEDVVRVFEGHREDAWRGVTLSRDDAAEAIGRCPLCGQDVVDRGDKARKWTCSSNRWRKGEDGTWTREAGCGFEMWKTACGKRLTKAQARALLTKGRTGVIHGFVGKSGKSFDAALTLGKDGRVGFEFPKGKGRARG